MTKPHDMLEQKMSTLGLLPDLYQFDVVFGDMCSLIMKPIHLDEKIPNFGPVFIGLQWYIFICYIYVANLITMSSSYGFASI